MATRVLWKGAISFGLVHIPVGLHTATSEQGIDFDWLDKRTMDPVGYKRVNKRTGKEISREHIVKGVQTGDGEYVVLSKEEIEAAFPKTTQTIEIERFVAADEIPFSYLERPYYLAPINKGAKVYALLRETLHESGKVGLATVVIQTKQHLAALMPCGPALVLNLLRWGDEVKPVDALDLPKTGSQKISPAERKMARQLVEEMSGEWNPDDFQDEFREQVMALVQAKRDAGDTQTVLQPEESAPESAEVIDLTALLQRSLGSKGGGQAPSRKTRSTKAPARKAAAKKAAAKAKPASKTGAGTAAPKRKAA
ncbi:MAG: Ku protein [Burkholderiaceae bacterium]|jgi:DNA end-binding protein Ku|nr:Ku protein [Burkholderiaceae bacterium]MCO5105208.1 Ku protein [Burkholderiaceae bacterium]